MSFFEELKRRKVFRAGAAYAVVSWVLVQGADVFFPALRLPDWTITLVVGLVLLGFPVALVLAWAYDLTPEGMRRVSATDAGDARDAPAAQAPGVIYAILGVLSLAVMVLVVDRYLSLPRLGPAGTVGSPAPSDAPVVAANLSLPEAAGLAAGVATIGFDSPMLALSPDGKWLAYAGRSEGGSVLYRHRMDSFEPPSPVPGTEGVIHAFFSPDSRSIGFLTDDRVKRVSVEGDDVQTIVEALAPVSAVWVERDTIFLIDDQTNSLQRIDIATRASEPMIGRVGFHFSDVHVDGRYVLVRQQGRSVSNEYADIQVLDLESGERTSLGIEGFGARWTPSGELLVARGGNLYRVPLDLDTLEVSGEPVVALRGVAMDSMFGQAQYALSASGTVAFVPGGDLGVGEVVAIDDRGVVERLPIAANTFGVLDISADGRQVAFQVLDSNDYVWIYDLEQGTGRKLAGSEGFGWPKFSRQGALAVAAVRPSEREARVKVIAPGAGVLESVFESDDLAVSVSDWFPDGSGVAISEFSEGRSGLLRLADEPTVEWMDKTGSSFWGTSFSPDGRWISYSSDETGRFEIWIQSLADPTRRRQLSTAGGIESVWCPCGEVFYRRGDQFFAVRVATDPELTLGTEELRFTVSGFLDTPGRSYDIKDDGRTLYTIVRAQPALSERIHVIANWLQGLAPLPVSP